MFNIWRNRKKLTQSNIDAFKEACQSAFPVVSRHIKRYYGSSDDAHDIFQETLIAVYRKLKDGKIEKLFSLDQYIIIASINNWTKELNKRKVESNDRNNYNTYLLAEAQTEDCLEQKKCELIDKYIVRLEYNDKNFMRLALSGKNNKEIAEIMGYNNAEAVKKRKSKIIAKLRDRIMNDPEFKNHINSISIECSV